MELPLGNEYHVAFDSPWYLLLLVLAPLVWWFSFRTLSGLGPVRRVVVLLLRTAVLVMLILAVAEAQWVRSSDRLTVLYVLDQSKSIPKPQRDAMIEYVNASIREHRKRDDRAGVIVFGRNASIEVPPFDESVQMAPEIESLLDPDYTNLAAAVKLAQASFPSDAAKRVVIVSDGNQNQGDILEQAQAAADAGVGIDVVPVSYSARAEVSVEKITLPADVRKGQPFDLRVVVNNASEVGDVSGRLVISQQTDDAPVVLSEQPITLPPGKRVYSIRQQLDIPSFYTYEARFIPDTPADDAMPENNRATAYTHISGSGQVLLIDDHERPGQFNHLAERLGVENIEVTRRGSDQLFTGLEELQQFDSVILANVPREHFSDEQITMLAHNTQHLGAGLIMLGGENSYGAGGWMNTEVEAALPLDFQIKSAKIAPKGALALLMHASELADGNHWQKVVAQEAIKTLGNQDYCALLHWNGQERWLWGGASGFLPVGRYRARMLAEIDRMIPGDMPDFDPGMKMAAAGFARLTDAAIKHMIIISDGDPTPPTRRVLQQFVTQGVTISTVAVGTHGPAGSGVLQDISATTGGKYYAVNSGKALPKIYQKEARRVARPLIHEDPAGFQPQLKYPHEMLAGVDGPLPPITGYVMTTAKQNPLVDVSLVSPVPAGEENTTILASWTYGLGKGVCFTTDAGARWANEWTAWGDYDKFFSQMVRWSMRPSGDQGKFTVATDTVDGKTRVIITALDKNDEFLNFLDMSGMIIGPGMEPVNLKLEQTAPGRYLGEFEAADAGSYFVVVSPGAGQAPIRSGVNVPYSAEFRDRETNTPLLESLASMTPKGGQAGTVIQDPVGGGAVEELLKFDTFRRDLPKAMRSQDVWFYLAFLAGCTFFFDVFFRRVSVSFAWAGPLAVRVRDKVLRREPQPEKAEYMERLRNRKAEVFDNIEKRRSAARFEPQPDAAVDPAALEQDLAQPAASKERRQEPTGGALAPDAPEEESYTSRLLKAKKKVWEQRNPGNES